MEYEQRLPNRIELSEWSEEQYLAFLNFCRHFIEDDPKGATWRVTVEKRKTALSHTDWREFLDRLTPPPVKMTTGDRQFYYRLVAMVRLVLGYLRLNQERITLRMREVIEPSPRLNWCLAIKQASSEIVTVRPYPTNPQEQIASTLDKVANLCYRLADSITPKDIAKMSPKDRVLALGRLQFVYGASQRTKRPTSVFRQIDIEHASIRELEEIVLQTAQE